MTSQSAVPALAKAPSTGFFDKPSMFDDEEHDARNAWRMLMSLHPEAIEPSELVDGLAPTGQGQTEPLPTQVPLDSRPHVS